MTARNNELNISEMSKYNWLDKKKKIIQRIYTENLWERINLSESNSIVSKTKFCKNENSINTVHSYKGVGLEEKWEVIRKGGGGS